MQFFETGFMLQDVVENDRSDRSRSLTPLGKYRSAHSSSPTPTVSRASYDLLSSEWRSVHRCFHSWSHYTSEAAAEVQMSNDIYRISRILDLAVTFILTGRLLGFRWKSSSQGVSALLGKCRPVEVEWSGTFSASDGGVS